MKLEPGIHHNLGMDVYHAWALDKANLKAGPISCSMLKDFAVNPYAWLRSEPKTTTDAMKVGSIMDAALTEPDRLEGVVAACYGPQSDCVAPFSDFKTKAAQQWRDEQLAQGLDPISGNAYEAAKAEFEAKAETLISNARACAEAVRNHAVAGPVLDSAEFQTGAVAEIGGIPAKCLVDIAPKSSAWDETLWDFKVTSNGLDDESIRKTISNFRLHWQAGFYRTNWNKASSDRHCEHFGFIFLDPKTREVRVVILDDDSMALGTRCVREAVKEYTRAAYNGIHSRYAKKASTLGIMPYTGMAEEEWIIQLEQTNETH